MFYAFTVDVIVLHLSDRSTYFQNTFLPIEKNSKNNNVGKCSNIKLNYVCLRQRQLLHKYAATQVCALLSCLKCTEAFRVCTQPHPVLRVLLRFVQIP